MELLSGRCCPLWLPWLFVVLVCASSFEPASDFGGLGCGFEFQFLVAAVLFSQFVGSEMSRWSCGVDSNHRCSVHLHGVSSVGLSYE